MLIAILLEVAANIFVKYSDSFRHRGIGALGIASILVSFTALSQAAKGIDLSIAYAIWGGTGIFLTTVAGRALFKEHISRKGWLGITLIVTGLSLLKLS